MIPPSTLPKTYVRLIHPMDCPPGTLQIPAVGSIGITVGKVHRDQWLVPVDFGDSGWLVPVDALELLELVSEDPDPKEPSCLSCRFFRRGPHVWGYCHRHAPSSMDTHGVGEWPRTYDVDTCGDHEPGNLPGAHSRSQA